MTDIEQRAFGDLDNIAELSKRALEELAHGDIHEAQVYLEDIHGLADQWDDPQDN